jgi:hypothetical protein
VSFILRILFSGLITLVPNQDGTEVTVLLLNVDHTYHTSDGAPLAPHKPLLLARAGSCSGDCSTSDADIAAFLYADKSDSEAADSLAAAVDGGGAWDITGSDLSVSKASSGDPALPALVVTRDARGTVNGQPEIIPTTASEREDFSWVASLSQICPSGCSLNSGVFDSQPPGLVAARLHLRSGKVFTYSVARIGSDITPVRFQRLDGQGDASNSQAIASWVGADIQVSADSVEIVDEKFNGDPGRSMVLSPDSNGKVEVAVLNLPPFIPPASAVNDAPEVGKHFEMYYELMQSPPTRETRLVPRAGAASGVTYPEIGWSSVHPSTLWSELLNQLRLDIGRTVYDRTLCPLSQYP